MAAEARTWFYRLDGLPMARALGPLLERCLDRGWRVLVVAGPERLEALERQLWTWSEQSFTPHGLASDPDPELQPVLLSESGEAINGAEALVLLDGADAGDAKSFARHIVLFDDDGGALTEKVRGQYRGALKEGGARYFFRDGGRWAEKTSPAQTEG